MANDEHVALLKQGVDAWNAWRRENHYDIRPNLRAADLRRANLGGANLSGADFTEAHLSRAYLGTANLSGAHFFAADLNGANLSRADLARAQLSKACLIGADLRAAHLDGATLIEANLREADLSGADLCWANLRRADLSEAKLIGAFLREANLRQAGLGAATLIGANLSGANLSEADLGVAKLIEANLSGAQLVDTDLTGADLTSCRIFGISAWRLKLEGAKQQSLVITNIDEPAITVDNIEVAQFIYLMLHNQKIRDVIDTITSKAVLILGRFTDERKAVLDALRDELRKRNYLPIMFDFDKPASQDLIATVSTLAHLARFIIADLTDPSAIPYELATIVPTTPVPIQPILLSDRSENAMFQELRRRHHWVLTTHRYADQARLLAGFGDWVIRPAERKVRELRG